VSLDIEEDQPGMALHKIREDHKRVSPKCGGEAEPLYDYKAPEDKTALKKMYDYRARVVSLTSRPFGKTDSIGE